MQTDTGTIVGAENMDPGGSGASIGNEELDLPKFVAFKSLSNECYLHPVTFLMPSKHSANGRKASNRKHEVIKFGEVDAISYGVKHEVEKAKCGGGLVHIRCCDANKYWSWDLFFNASDITLRYGPPVEDKSKKHCTLIKPSQCTKDGVRSVNFQLLKEGKWCSIGGRDWEHIEDESFRIIDWASVLPKMEMDLPKFVVFRSLSNKNHVRPGGKHMYMKSEAEDVVKWGVKHEVEKSKYADGLVHVRCCDTGRYWSWGLSEGSCDFITSQAYQPGDDTRDRTCTLIKPSHNTKDGVEVVNLEVMYKGKWRSVGVNSGGHLVADRNECFIVSDWESFEANQQQKPSHGAKNMDIGGTSASIRNEELDLPKFVAIKSLMNKKYLIRDSSDNIKFEAVDVQSLSIKLEVQKAKCEDNLIHIKCWDTGNYWSWGDTRKQIVARATKPNENKYIKFCTLIKPSQYIKDGVRVVHLKMMHMGEWYSIGGNGDGYLLIGGEDFIVSDWETLQMGLTEGPRGGWVAKSITTKLSRANYSNWKQQMLTFLLSEELSGYVDGTIRPAREETDYAHAEWKRLDGLVRGWILATLTGNILRQVTKFETAREVWMELKKILASPFQLSLIELIEMNDQKRGQIVSKYVELHKAILKADLKTAVELLDINQDAVREPITSCLETALIVAIRSPKRNDFVKELIRRMVNFPLTVDEMEGTAPMVGALLALQDISGATALHAAVDGGNIEAAKLLLVMHPKLANIENKHGALAVHVAAGLGNRMMVELLLTYTTVLSKNLPGLRLLHFLASSGLYDIAFEFLQEHPYLAGLEPSPLVVIALQHTSFPSGTSLNFLWRSIYSGISLKFKYIAKDHPQGRDMENNLEDNANHPQAWKRLNALFWIIAKDSLKKLNSLFWSIAEKLESKVLIGFNCQLIKSVRETKLTHYRALNLVNCLCNKVVTTNPMNAAEIFTEPLRNATRLGIHEIVEEILQSYPNAMHLRSEENQSLFHLAVMYRQENIFNLIYQMEEDWRALLSMPDASKNNALHLAGNLGPEQQLGLRASAAGAALQMQRELQWFKEVGNLLLPQAKERKNEDEKTPQELFTETHKDLVEKGEKWMKSTANSCSIVAVLITTIVFAAAITVPGGSGGNEGLPLRLGNGIFTLFMVADALAMFSSSSSLLMFLSILTSRYGEQDFLFSLPLRMIIGLATLFLSIIFMMVAFAATLYIVSGKTNAWIITCVAILSCVPITLFALLQLPLLYDMFKSTYFPSIGKQNKRIFHQGEENDEVMVMSPGRLHQQ